MPDRAFFDKYYGALTRADFETLKECYAPDVVLTHKGGALEGRDVLLGAIAASREVVENEVVLLDIVTEGGKAAVVFSDRFESRQDNLDFMGRKLSRGERFEERICGFYRFEDGRIKAVQMFSAS